MVISVIAVLPSPSSPIVIGYGWSWLNGVSPALVVTPEAIGYSKLSDWPAPVPGVAMISCPCLLTRKARNFWAAA